jgi:hypothetical protein
MTAKIVITMLTIVPTPGSCLRNNDNHYHHYTARQQQISRAIAEIVRKNGVVRRHGGAKPLLPL